MAVDRKGVRCARENTRNAVRVSIQPHNCDDTLERNSVKKNPSLCRILSLTFAICCFVAGWSDVLTLSVFVRRSTVCQFCFL